MSSINKLSIRGVRSFSPDDDEQVIEFLKPVTIIVGANGCGKTTIIESLKYAVTGSLPPGKNAGQSFVHDPKSIGQSSVKASVKLRFTNRANGVMVLVRSMEVTQKKTKLEFKSLDGVLRTTDAQGNRVSMSHKCNELDRQVPIILGVSKPVLEHVVFCHQEESSWPLMDSAVLKKRFDDIFDSTRYTKALKNIDEIKKEYRDKVKDLKADLSGLASHKHAANDYRKELTTQKDKLEALEEEVQEAVNEVREAEKLMEKHKEVIDQMEELNADLDDKNQEWERQQAVLDTQQSYLEEDLTERHSARELKDMLRDFEEQAEQRNEKRRDLERDRERLREDLETIAQESNQCMSERGKLESDKERYQDLLQQRLQMMEELAEKWGIELAVTQTQSQSVVDASQESASILHISESDMNAFMRVLNEKEDALKAELNEHKTRAEGCQDEIQNALSDLNARQMSFESEKQKILQEIRDAQKELLSLKSQGATGRTRQSDIDEARRQADHFAKERDKANNDPRKSEIPIEIRSFEDKIDKLKRAIEDDLQAVRDLRQNADHQNSINVLKEQVSKELEALKESIDDQNYDLERFHIPVPEFPGAADTRGEALVIAMENLSSAVADKLNDEHEGLEKAIKEVTAKDRSISEKTALLSHSKQASDTTRARLDALTGENGSVSTYQRVISAIRQFAVGAGIVAEFDEKDPQSVVSFLSDQLEELDEMTDDAVEVGRKLIKRLKMMARVVDDEGNVSALRCPCCLTGLEVEELKVFKKNMDELGDPAVSSLFKVDPEKIQRDRATKKNFERWRKTVSNSIGDMAEHKRLLGESQNLSATIKELESNVAEMERDCVNLKSDRADLEIQVNDLRQLSTMAKRWVDDATKISSKKMEINRKNDDLSLSLTALSTTDNRDLRTVERQLEEEREEKDTLLNRINRLNKEMTQINTRIANLSSQASRTDQLVKEREARFAEEQQAASRKIELNECIRKWQEDEKKLSEQMAALRPKIRAKEQERQKQREHNKEEEERLGSHVSSFTSEVSSLKNLQRDIQRSAESQEESNLDTLNEKLERLEERKREKEGGIKAIEPELERVIRSINDQESHKKLIQGNIELIRVRARCKELRKEIDGLKEDLGKIEGHDVAIDEYEAAKQRKSLLLDSKARLEGRRNGFFEQITSLQRKLKTPEYKNIDERHRHAMIKHNTTQIAVSDLDKYQQALDKALLRYHGIKIAEINKIIRELWTLTYKGQDITNIEIVSGQEPGSKASKSYNYRVVMTKGGTQLDMRGRCSAGQRVLASIVIRLALAETFCLQFGCIALDEPTVNLDFNNKKGLAIALSQIIGARAQQSNFQLVVITHDEEFVSMMKTELSTQTGFSMPERYYQVRREEGIDNRFYSKIDAVDWSELI